MNNIRKMSSQSHNCRHSTAIHGTGGVRVCSHKICTCNGHTYARESQSCVLQLYLRPILDQRIQLAVDQRVLLPVAPAATCTYNVRVSHVGTFKYLISTMHIARTPKLRQYPLPLHSFTKIPHGPRFCSFATPAKNSRGFSIQGRPLA